MKKSTIKNRILLLIVLMLCMIAVSVLPVFAADVEINATNFPDDNFRAFIKTNYDDDGNGKLSADELLYLNVIFCSGYGIENMKGIELIPNLTRLYCHDNNLQTLDVSNCPKLDTLFCSGNQMTSLTIGNSTTLTYLRCEENNLQSLDVTGCPNLKYLFCEGNQLKSIDVSHNPVLETFKCHRNQISELNLSNNPLLWIFSCNDNPLQSLDVSNNGNLMDMWCYNTLIKKLDCSQNNNLRCLYCINCQLEELNLSANSNLFLVWCGNNKLTNLDVSNSPKLRDFRCANNPLQSLNVSGCPVLSSLWCESSQLNSLDVSTNPNLQYLVCRNNNLTSLDVSNNPDLLQLFYEGNKITSLDLSNNNNLTSETSDDGTNVQTYDTLLKSKFKNNMYEFDLNEIAGIDIQKVINVKQEDDTALPANANYDSNTGILSIDPADKFFGIIYYSDLSRPGYPQRSLKVSVDLAYRYNVTYQDEHGNVIGTPQVVDHGGDAVPEAFPNKAGHTGDWDHDGTNITSETLIRPNYVIMNFLVTYQDEDGNVLGVPQVVNYGAAAVPEAIPYKIGYNGEWDHDGKNIMGNTLIRPIYTVMGFVVRYQDEDGNPIGQMQVVNYGCDAKPEAIPYKEGYTGRWDHDGRNVMRHLTIKPIYEIKRFNVVYKNDRGETVGTPQTVNYGQDATPERFPEKEGYAGGWSHDGKNIKADTVIQALYTIKKYTVTYQDEHGKTIGLPQTVEHGSDATPERVPEKEGYIGEWSLNGRNIVADTVIKPLYTIRTYTVTYLDERDNIIGIPQNVNHGSDVSRPEAVPPKTGYTGSWNHDGRNITADTVIKPIYTIRTFVVTYQDEDGKTVGKPQTVAYGANATPEAIPVREGVEASWNHDGRNITQDTIIRLICKCEEEECPGCVVIYQDESGNVIGIPQEITPGSNAVPEAVPEKPGYTGKWNHDGRNITANTTIKPVYAAEKIEPSVRTPTFMTKIGDGKELLASTVIVFLWIILLLLLTRRKKETQ